MKQLWVLTLTVAMLVAAPLLAEAKRMGGGSWTLRSPIQQRHPASSHPACRSCSPANCPTAATGANQCRPGRKAFGGRCHAGRLGRWFGLGLVGQQLRLGEGFANILMIGLLVMAGLAIFRMVKVRSQAASASGAGAAPFAFSGQCPRPGCSGRCVQSSSVQARESWRRFLGPSSGATWPSRTGGWRGSWWQHDRLCLVGCANLGHSSRL